MEYSINLICSLVVMAAVYFVYILIEYKIHSKKICGLCMGKGVVSDCCSSPIAFMFGDEKPDIKHTVCTECGSVCKTGSCIGKHT